MLHKYQQVFLSNVNILAVFIRWKKTIFRLVEEKNEQTEK